MRCWVAGPHFALSKKVYLVKKYYFVNSLKQDGLEYKRNEREAFISPPWEKPFANVFKCKIM